MKKYILILIGFFSAVLMFSQSDCNVITFSYDAAGNRVQRSLTVKPCQSSPLKKKDNTPQAKTDSASAALLNINVFPNPAQDNVTVEINQAENKEQSVISLYDLNGRLIYSETTTLDRLQVDVSALGAGEYYLNVVRGKNRVTYSVIKN